MLMISVMMPWHDALIQHSNSSSVKYLPRMFFFSRLIKHEKKCRDEYQAFKHDMMNYEQISVK